MARKRDLNSRFALGKKLLLVWVLINCGALYTLQSNLKNTYRLHDVATSLIAQAKVSAHGLLAPEAQAEEAAKIPLIIKASQTFISGGILPNENLVVKAQPEEISLRSEALIASLKIMQATPTMENYRSVEGDCILLQAGFQAQALQAEDNCLLGIGALGLLNALLLIVTLRFSNTLVISKVTRLQRGIRKNEIEKLEGTPSDELDEVSANVNEIKKEILEAESIVSKTGEGIIETIATDNRHPLTSDLFKSLQHMQFKMQKVAQDDKQRNWTSTGLAQFVDILRSKDDDLEGLANIVIGELVKYLNANQGALYLVETEGDKSVVLRQKACYAFGRRKWLEKEFMPGDGIIGQVYLEKGTLYMTEVPSQYINITSGLGDAPPTSVLVVPLVINEEVMGILEIAGFNQFEDFEIKFVEKLGENIAATLANVRNGQHTRRLLEESQIMAESLQAQEEEMRQSMEELTATQEEMTRKEIELNGQISAINNTLATVEFTMDGIVLTANENFQRVMKYSLGEVKQNHHRIFCNADYAQSEDYVQFWKELNQGKTQQGEFSRINKKGEQVWLRASYTPVLDGKGAPIKVIKCAFDITEEKQRDLQNSGQLVAINNTLATAEYTMEGIIIAANDNFEALTEHKIEEILYSQHAILCDAEYAASEVYEQHWAGLNKGEAQAGEFQYVSKSGRQLWFRATYTPVLGANGKPHKVIQCALDITAEKRTDLDRRAQLNAINISNGKIELMPEGTIVGANSIVTDLLNVTEETLFSTKLDALFDVEEMPGFNTNAIWETMRAGQSATYELALKTTENSTVWMSTSFSPVVSEKGKLEKVIVIGQDVTGRKLLEQQSSSQISQMKAQEEFMQETMVNMQAQEEELQQTLEEMQAQEEELRQNMEEMQAIQEEMHSRVSESEQIGSEIHKRLEAMDKAAAIFEIDPKKNFLYINSQFGDIAGLSQDELLSQPFSKLYCPDTAKSVYQQVWSILKKNDAFKGRFPILAKGQADFWIDVTIVPVHDEEGKLVKYTGIGFPVNYEEEKILRLQYAEVGM